MVLDDQLKGWAQDEGGGGSEIRGESVLEMPVAGLDFQLSSWFPKACGVHG